MIALKRGIQQIVSEESLSEEVVDELVAYVDTRERILTEKNILYKKLITTFVHEIGGVLGYFRNVSLYVELLEEDSMMKQVVNRSTN